MADPQTASLVTLAEIRDAAPRIAHVVRRTPLIDVGGFGAGPSFAVKCENMQPAGAFKIRGACNMLMQLSPEARAAGVDSVLELPRAAIFLGQLGKCESDYLLAIYFQTIHLVKLRLPRPNN